MKVKCFDIEKVNLVQKAAQLAFVVVLSLLVLTSCRNQTEGNQKRFTKSYFDSLGNRLGNASSLSVCCDTINGAIGIVVPNENYQFGESIDVYTSDGELLKRIVKTEENQVIALMCVAQDKQYYQVELDNKEVGYVQIAASRVTFQNWEEHLLSVFAVDFDIKTNPLKKKPEESSDTLYYDSEEFYHPVQIRNEWLQVKWGHQGGWNYGWIKWKAQGKLLIYLYYFA